MREPVSAPQMERQGTRHSERPTGLALVLSVGYDRPQVHPVRDHHGAAEDPARHPAREWAAARPSFVNPLARLADPVKHGGRSIRRTPAEPWNYQRGLTWRTTIRLHRKPRRLMSSLYRWVPPSGSPEWSMPRPNWDWPISSKSGPKSAAELAAPMRVHAPSLHRLMRTLASLGILTEREAQRFALTPLGAALKTGAPGSARSSLLTLGSNWLAGAFERHHALPGNRQNRLREGVGNASLRLSRSTSRGCVPVQRDDDRHPWWRAPGGRRGLRFLGV